MRFLIPTESPVTHRWHCSGFSRAGAVPNLAGRFSWGRKPAPREARRRVGEHKGRSFDLPETPAGSLEPGRASSPLPPPASKLPQGSWEPVAAGRSEGGGANGAGRGVPAGAGRACGGGACGLQAPGSAAPAGLHTSRGSALLARSSQVRTPRAGWQGRLGDCGDPGRKGSGRARGERWLPQAQTLTFPGIRKILSPTRRGERGPATPGEGPGSPSGREEGAGARSRGAARSRGPAPRRLSSSGAGLSRGAPAPFLFGSRG